MRQRRVLHLVRGLGLGGTEKAAVLAVCGLRRSARFEAALWSPQDGPRAEAVRAAGAKLFIGGEPMQAMRRFLPHILHIHRPGWPQPDFMRSVRGGLHFLPDGRHLPRIVETNVFGRRDISPGGKLIERTLFVSHFCARRFAAVEGVELHPARYGVLYNPVDADFLETHTRPPEARDYGLPVTGRISRADKGKWSRITLDMLPRLARLVPDFRFRIVGGIAEAENFVRENGLEARVDFLPPLHGEGELARFLDTLSVLAHGNDTGESFGMVIAEAMAAGLPVVTHPCEGMKDNAQLELVEDGVTGFIAENAEDYAAALARLFAHPDLAGRMGRAGREKARRLYALEVIVRQLEAVYDELVPLEEDDVAG